MFRFASFAAFMAVAAPALAVDKPFDQLVDESIGYVNIGPGIILIEDDVSSTVCRVYLPDEYFGAYLQEDPAGMAAADHEIVCVPSRFLSDASLGRTPDDVPFDALIDRSIGYANIGPGLLLVEDDVSSNVCRVEIDDVFFFSFAEADANGMAQSAPVIICVPSPLLSQ